MGESEKNTERRASIFDAQPSQQGSGNIHSVSDTSEPVLGYISASTTQKQRIYITNNETQHWGYRADAEGTFIWVSAAQDQIQAWFGGQGYVRLFLDFINNRYSASLSSCVDCRWLGGDTTKSAF